MNPRYELPSVTFLKERLLPDIFETVKDKLAKLLNKSNYVSITTDIWTCSFTTDAYITFTCHFIVEDNLKSCILETSKLEGQHTAVVIANNLQVSTDSGIYKLF